jgi:hypothetical protein
MANTFYGKNGACRIYDSTRGRDLSQSAPKEIHVTTEVGGVHTDQTANALNPSAGTFTILALAANHVYIGNKFKFGKVTLDLLSIASADGGLLVVEYWNGTTWVPVTNLVDGTAVSGNTMRQDGSISFLEPADWATNDVPATGTALYYIRMNTTANTATDAVAELVEVSSGQYYEVVFHQMNLTAPEGNARPEEIPRMNRMQLDANTHYIQGTDEVILQPPPQLTFSAWLDSVHNKTALAQALACGNPNIATWNKPGISTKTDTKLPAGLTGTEYNTPLFTDPTKKAVCVQAKWDDLAGSGIMREYNEVYIPSGSVTLNEAPDSVTLQLTGGIYGSVKSDLNVFGYRY